MSERPVVSPSLGRGVAFALLIELAGCAIICALILIICALILIIDTISRAIHG